MTAYVTHHSLVMQRKLHQRKVFQPKKTRNVKLKFQYEILILYISLHFVIDAMVSFVLPQSEVCHNFFFNGIVNLSETTGNECVWRMVCFVSTNRPQRAES
jgi:hypothetical protein